jgi:hypothetical protein
MKKNKNTPYFIGGGIAALVVVGVLAFSMGNSNLFQGYFRFKPSSPAVTNVIKDTDQSAPQQDNNSTAESLTATNENFIDAYLSNRYRDWVIFRFMLPPGSAPQHAYFYINDKLISQHNTVVQDDKGILVNSINTNLVPSDADAEKFIYWQPSPELTFLQYHIDSEVLHSQRLTFRSDIQLTTKVKLCNASETICSFSINNQPLQSSMGFIP